MYPNLQNFLKHVYFSGVVVCPWCHRTFYINFFDLGKIPYERKTKCPHCHRTVILMFAVSDEELDRILEKMTT